MKMEFEAKDKKAGMTLAELEKHVQTLVGLAETNGTDLSNSRVSVMVNIKAGIKSLSAEV